MNKVSVCTKERKKQLSVDLLIIAIVTFIVLLVVVIGWGNGMTEFANNQSINIVIRVLVIVVCGQFGIEGLGITIVCLFRKESFKKFGLNTKNLLPTLGLSLLCCVPDFIYCLINGRVHAWCPFWMVC